MDALSRLTDGLTLEAISGPIWDIWARLRESTKEADDLIEIKKKIEDEDQEVNDEYEWRDELLLFHGKVMVTHRGELHKEVIQHFHDSGMGGHSGICQTWSRIVSTFYWAKMKLEEHM